MEKTTNEESEKAKNLAVAEACGVSNLFVLIKRGLYYRPNGHGYTSNIDEAWKLTEEEAKKYVCPHDEPIIKRAAPLPNYGEDLNACHEAEKALTDEEWETYVKLIISPLSYMSDGISRAGSRKLAHATASQRREAFLRTIKKHKGS